MPVCTNCGKEIIPGKQFCIHCGTKVNKPDALKYCTHCGTLIKDFGKFCTVCGIPVSNSPANITGENTQTATAKIQNPALSKNSYTQTEKQQPRRAMSR